MERAGFYQGQVDPAEEIDAVERLIEEFGVRIELCRQAMILSRGAIACGVAVIAIVMSFAPAYNTGSVILSALTAVIGGLVWLGANASSQAEFKSRRVEAEQRQAALFEEVAARNGWAASNTLQ